jgi:hypothetical protein
VSARAGFLFGVLAAALAAIPATLRAESAPLVWMALTGAMAALLGPLLAALPRLRPMQTGLLAVLIGIGLASWPTALLLSVLKSGTHHRPLGAVTFAMAAGLLLLATSAAALRLLTWFRADRNERVAHTARIVLVVCAAAGPLVLLLRVGASPQARTSLFDASLALGLAALTLLVPWPARLLRGAERVGVLVWALAVGAGVLAASAAVEPANAASPVLLSPFAWLLR